MSIHQGRIAIICGVLLATAASAQDYTVVGHQSPALGVVGTGAACADGGCVGGQSVWDQSGIEEACGDCGCGNWFFSVNGLIFNRDNDDDVFLTFQTADGEPLLTSRSAEMDWSGGFETRLGRYFNCGRNAIEATYWGIFPGDQQATALAANALGDLATPLQFDGLFIDPAGANTPVADYFNNTAEMHRVQRSYEIHNVELNLMGLAGFGGASAWGCGCSNGACGGGCGSGVAFTWLMGPRFMRFREDFLFASDLGDTQFTGTPDELGYQIDVENNLIGFQLGGRADWCLSRRCGFYSGVKLGVYANDINHHQAIWDGVGNIAEVNDPTSPFDGEVYDVSSNKTDVSMIGELDLGLSYRLSRCWSMNVGYRAVGVSGVALAPSQIPRDFFDNIQGVRDIESNGNLILHGGYGGVSFNY